VFLGIDCSTQSLSAILIDDRKIVYEKSLNYERTFPQYKTNHGFLRTASQVHSPPLMWIEALDRLFQDMRSEDVPLHRILAISGSAQQHGSVYLNDSFSSRLLDHTNTLKENLEHAFSRKTAPIWMDSSTTNECEEIRQALGGKQAALEMTGSDIFERFTGPQIRRFYKTEPEQYQKTTSIALVSSFMASLLSGCIAPIDFGDGSGMSLMDIRKKGWHPKAIEATAPHLLKKLPPLAESSKVIGPVNPYFVKRYALNPEALSLVWTGDNPSSLIGLGLIEEGIVGASLGTSFTYFGALKSFHVDPAGEGHLFVSPTGDYMPLNCFLNGALAIERMRKHYQIDWAEFDKAILKAKPASGILLPYFEPEIIPKVLNPSVQRIGLDEKDVPANCRSLVEGQLLSMRLHSKWMGLKPKVIYATGGVSHDGPILQILADVMNCTVYQSAVAKSTALGAALRAASGYYSSKGHPRSWKETVAGFTDPIPSSRLEPDPKNVQIYNRWIEKYAACERDYLKNLSQ